MVLLKLTHPVFVITVFIYLFDLDRDALLLRVLSDFISL